MRRAMCLMMTVLGLLATVFPGPVRAAVPTLNAVGLIDYSRKPTFKPGDWVRYHVWGQSDKGERQEYRTTIVIAGEERFWGEDCFWVETWTEPIAGGMPPSSVATLMSYGIFGDSLALSRMKLYMRKQISDVDRDGNPIQEVTKRPQMSMRSRRPPGGDPWKVDTIGVDTVQAPTGSYTCRVVRLQNGHAVTAERPDSTVRDELWDTRVDYMTHEVPITSLAREKIEHTATRQSWQVGRSEDARRIPLETSAGEARLEAFGSGLVSERIPERFRRPLSEQDRVKTTAGAPPARKRGS